MKYTQDKKQSWHVQLLAGQKGLCNKGKVACGSQPTKPLRELSSIASLKLALIFPPVKSGPGIRLFLRFAETESISSLRRLRTVWCEMQGSKVGRIWAPKANVSLTTDSTLCSHCVLEKVLLSELHGRYLAVIYPKASPLLPC